MTPYRQINTARELIDFTENLVRNNIKTIAMDFEEESNLHVYGEHLCLVQIFDGTEYSIIDAVVLREDPNGRDALKYFLESSVEKIMFDCSSDAAIVRKTMKIQLKNIWDIRIPAMVLGFEGNLNALIERNLHIQAENPELKKKYQRTNWIKRPLSEEQKEYALGDVRYLFDLKKSLDEEIKNLDVQSQNKVKSLMRSCASQKHKEKPGWEKICNYRALNRQQKTYLRHFFTMRDILARNENVPPTNILEKQILVAMAKNGTWDGLLDSSKLKYSKYFEQARLNALVELNRQ